MLIMIFHFVNKNMQQQILFFFLKKIIEFHTKKNIIQIVLCTFDNYAIRNNLNYFVMNNAKNNNIMLKIISRVF